MLQKPMSLSDDGLPLMGTEDFGYFLKQRPGCFFICGSEETRRVGLSALPFDGGEGYHPSVADDEPPATKRPRRSELLMQPGAGWANGQTFSCGQLAAAGHEQAGCDVCVRTNCCPHGTAYDFNDNVLPYVLDAVCCVYTCRRLIDLSLTAGTWASRLRKCTSC